MNIETAPDLRESDIFVGRAAELNQLRAHFESTVHGSSRVVLLTGEPGIGKTRTVEEFARHCSDRDARILSARCYESSRSTPYWPWVQILRSFLQEPVLEDVRQHLGLRIRYIESLIPDLRDTVEEEPVSALDPERERLRFFDSVSALLKYAGTIQPLVLTFDDLHWIDQSSLLLLEFLLPELRSNRIMMVGAYRRGEVSQHHPLALTIGELARESNFQHLHLQGLDLKDVRSYVNALGIRSSDRDLAEFIFQRTEGNPFFMVEVLRLLQQEDAGIASPGISIASGSNPSWAVGIPDGVRGAIRRRLSGLSELCNSILTAASATSGGFDLALLRNLHPDQSLDSLVSAIDEAASAGVIEERSAQPVVFTFNHTLIKETIASEISPVRRAKLHADIAESLEQRYNASAKMHAAELAHHFSEASMILGTEKLYEYSLIAGRQALDSYAYEEAIAHFETALTAPEFEDSGSTRAELLFDLSRAKAATLDTEEALSHLSASFDMFVEQGEIDDAIRVVNFSHSANIVMRMTDLLARALTMVERDSLPAARIMSSYGFSLGIGRDAATFDTVRSLMDEALTIARREGDSSLEVRILANLANVAGQRGRWSLCAEYSAQAIGLESEADSVTRLRAYLWAAHSHYALGQPHRTESYLRMMEDIADEVQDRYWLTTLLRSRLILAASRGQWKEALDLGERCHAINPRDLYCLADMAYVSLQISDFETARRYLDRFNRVLNSPANSGQLVNLALLQIELGTDLDSPDRPSNAVEVVEDVQDLAREGSLLQLSDVVRLGLPAITADQTVVDADRIYRTLSPFSHTFWWYTSLSIDRLLGDLASLTGKVDVARTHFEIALDLCGSAGFLPEKARVCLDYAWTLTDSEKADSSKLNSLIQEGSDLAVSLEMTRLASRFEDLASALDKRQAGRAYPDGLTTREVEVLGLIARGYSNREIASDLVISNNTVMHHVSRILRKTSSNNRAEATAYAFRHELISASQDSPPS